MVDGDASASKKIIVQKPTVSLQFKARLYVEQQVRTGVLRGLYYIWIVGLWSVHSTSPVQVLFPINISKQDMDVKLHSEDEEHNKSDANPVT